MIEFTGLRRIATLGIVFAIAFGCGATLTGQDIQPKQTLAQDMGHAAIQRIQEYMQQAAAQLQSGVTDATTQQYQKQAVGLMDQLLEQLDQGEEDSASSEDSEESQERPANQLSNNQKNGASQQQQGKGEQKESQRNSDNEGQNGSPDGGARSSASGGNTPTGVAGPGKEQTFPLAPPVEQLSQGVWGHLPERVRRDLQTVTPEQYLPAYRAKIEAYYRKLSERK